MRIINVALGAVRSTIEFGVIMAWLFALAAWLDDMGAHD